MVTDNINQLILLPVITNQNHLSDLSQNCLAEIFNSAFLETSVSAQTVLL